MFKDFKNGRKVEVPASSIKRNQNIFSSLIHRVYQRTMAMDFQQNFKSKYLCSIGQKQRKTSQTSGFQTANQRRDFQAVLHFWHKKGISQWSKVSPKTAHQGLSPDSLHGREPNLHIFSATILEFKDFGLKLANSLQTGTQAKRIKKQFKITVKMLLISQDPWAACKLGLQINSSQQQFLKQEKSASVKSQRRGEPSTSSIILTEFTTVPPGLSD